MRQWMWNMSSCFKPEGPADDYGVLVITQTVYLNRGWSSSVLSVELLRHSLWSLSLKRDGWVCVGLGSDGSADSNPKSCSKTTPAGSASKELNRRLVPKSMFSPDQTLTHPLVKMRGTGKTWSFFYSFGRVWCGFSHVLAKSICSERNADQNLLKRFVHFVITTMKMLKLFPERYLILAPQKCNIVIAYIITFNYKLFKTLLTYFSL